MMNLFSIVNINEERKEHKKNQAIEKAETKRDYGLLAYQALEYGNRNNQKISHGIFTEFMKNSIR